MDTLTKFISENNKWDIYNGFSLLHMDLDIDEPTYITLQTLYDRVVRGGIIILDEYACDKQTESNDIDRFLKEHPELTLKTIPWTEHRPHILLNRDLYLTQAITLRILSRKQTTRSWFVHRRLLQLTNTSHQLIYSLWSHR